MSEREPPLPFFALRGAVDAVTAVVFAADSNTLVSGTASGSIETWDLTTYQVIHRIESAHDGSVLWLCNSDATTLLSQGRDGKAHFWSIVKGRLEHTGCGLSCGSLSYCRGSFCHFLGDRYVALPLHESFKLVCLGTKNERVLGKDDKRGMCLALKLVSHATAAAASSGQRLLAFCGTEDGNITVWDAIECCKLCSAKFHDEPVMCLSYDSKLARGFSGSADDVLVAWTFNNDSLERLQAVKLTNPGLNDIAVRGTDGRILATAGWDGRIRIYSVKSLKALAVLTFHREAVNCLDFSEQGDLASGSKDKLVCLWSIYKE